MDLLRQIKIEELRKEIQKGIDSKETGESVPFDVEEIKAEGRKRIAKKRKA